jgi:diguanylate cyclase (GGDEF)-like protein
LSRVFHRTGTKIILAIGAIWIPFMAIQAWYDMNEARKIALREVERWGVASGDVIRIGLNALMREGKMDSRFAYFQDLSSEIKGLESVRVIRSPRVNEIFRQVREQHDIPREEEFIRTSRQRIAELTAELPRMKDRDERSDAEAEIADLSAEIKHSEERIAKLREPLKTDDREVPRDDIERQVLASGEPVLKMEGDRMRMVAPYKAREFGCSQASGCHLYAKEGDVLGAVSMVFSVSELTRELQRSALLVTFGKLVVSLLILAAIFAIVNHIVIRNVRKLRKTMERIAAGNGLTDVAPTTGASSDFKTGAGPAKYEQEPLGNADNGDEFAFVHAGMEWLDKSLKENRGKLEKLATYDALTDLYNRRKFNAVLHDEILRYRRHHRPLSLLMIDLDHFKDINDAHGHQAGDEALRAVARTVNAEIRRTDVTARYGGEEIAVILPETSNPDAVALAERIRKAIDQKIIEYEPGKAIQLTASIGVATLSEETGVLTEDELLRSADAALYAAKRDGRNRVRNAHGKEADHPNHNRGASALLSQAS